MRVSDADRERAVEILKMAFEQERLSSDELDVRAERAYLSRTYDELTACTAGIPRRRPRPPASLVSRAAPTAVPANNAPRQELVSPPSANRSRKRVVKLAVGLSACIVIPPALVTAFFTYYGGFAVMMLVAVVGVIVTGSPVGPGASIRDRI